MPVVAMGCRRAEKAWVNDATVVTGNVDRSADVSSDAVGPELVSLWLVATASSSASSSPTASSALPELGVERVGLLGGLLVSGVGETHASVVREKASERAVRK